MYSTVSVAKQLSIAQSCLDYFSSEVLKTERKEERNFPTIIVQKKGTEKIHKLNYNYMMTHISTHQSSPF